VAPEAAGHEAEDLPDLTLRERLLSQVPEHAGSSNWHACDGVRQRPSEVPHGPVIIRALREAAVPARASWLEGEVMTDPSKKDSGSPEAPPASPGASAAPAMESDGQKVEAPVPAAAAHPADRGLGSFRIGVRGAMRPPVSIPVVQAKAKSEESPPPAQAEPPPAPRPKAATRKVASAPSRSAPAVASEPSSKRTVAAKPNPVAPPEVPPTPAVVSQPHPVAEPAPPPPEAAPLSTLARLRQAHRLAQKDQSSATRKDSRSAPRPATPLKRPWSKLSALADKKQKAGGAQPSTAAPKPAGRAEAKPTASSPVAPRKKRKP
jgi:hypothetical protein